MRILSFLTYRRRPYWTSSHCHRSHNLKSLLCCKNLKIMFRKWMNWKMSNKKLPRKIGSILNIYNFVNLPYVSNSYSWIFWYISSMILRIIIRRRRNTWLTGMSRHRCRCRRRRRRKRWIVQRLIRFLILRSIPGQRIKKSFVSASPNPKPSSISSKKPTKPTNPTAVKTPASPSSRNN